jgi:hypothetical protein
MCIGIQIELNIKETEAIDYERPTSIKQRVKKRSYRSKAYVHRDTDRT